MTRFDEMMGKQKEENNSKKLRLILDENDEILDSISQAMSEQNLLKVRLDTINGFLNEGTIIDDQTGQKVVATEKEIISAGGNFSLTAGDLWGTLSIFLDKRKPITGKLIRGRTKEGTTILLSFEEKDIKRTSKK